jgi:hypothetical protein
MTRFMRSKLPHRSQTQKKPWSKILNYLNIEGWNWKKNQSIKGLKNKTNDNQKNDYQI